MSRGSVVVQGPVYPDEAKLVLELVINAARSLAEQYPEKTASFPTTTRETRLHWAQAVMAVTWA
jgi:hypothetical protein